MKLRLFQNSIAYQNAIDKRVYIPDSRLAIETGEELAPVKGGVEYPHILKEPTEPKVDTVSYELASIDGFSEEITEDDFPKELYFGDPLGGF